ncbi:hypothetical protein HG1285_14684 [Hydrogenivirga sp. 128-5-R1-1]|nr:hypothetical protein HG1285_14684 [Hydrogenivirga sp. 128-5-R1-1]
MPCSNTSRVFSIHLKLGGSAHASRLRPQRNSRVLSIHLKRELKSYMLKEERFLPRPLYTFKTRDGEERAHIWDEAPVSSLYI